jgi:hypothetical protein
MRGRAGGRVGAVAAFLVLGLIFWAPGAAFASTDDIIAPSDPDNPEVGSGWQAGTCEEEPPESAEVCSVDTPEQFFETAAGHPQWGFTQFIVKHDEPLPGVKNPKGELKTVRVDLPRGLSVNPQATPQCPLTTFEDDPATCPPGSDVGYSEVTASVAGLPTPVVPPPTVYNIVPEPGEPARFGLHLLGNDIYLEADVEWEGDFHEGFTIHVPETPFAKALELGFPGLQGGVVLQNRLVFDGRSGDGTFITTPSTCFGPAVGERKHLYSTWLLASSIAEENQSGYEFPADARPPLESRIPPETEPKKCGSIPYDPDLDFDPETSSTESPSGAQTVVEVPHITGGGTQESSQTKRAELELPEGMGLNPSAANSLDTCTDDEFGKGTRDDVDCPSASRIGSVEVETPPLPPGALEGDVYVGEQLSRDPESGKEYRIFVRAESERYGVDARLIGEVSADRETGQLTTTFDDPEYGGLPQVPFSKIVLDLDGGAHAPLTSPPTCGGDRARIEMTPWSGRSPARPSDGFSMRSIPGGGPCPDSLGARPFAPGFQGIGSSPNAAGFTTLHFSISRPAGQQELKGAIVDLPPGLSARLVGVPYCSEAAIAVAGAGSGEAQKSAPSCPAASRLGAASVAAGSGSDPLRVNGTVYLAGPYKGAPLSLAVITPATAGPFDLGTVVVRVALHVHPETARVRAVSDPIPHVFGGATLSVRSVALAIDRPGFALNPTKCLPMATYGTLAGGGSDPVNPAAYTSVVGSSHFQVRGCKKMGFKPRLFLRLFGANRRAKNPKLRAVLMPRGKDANVSRAAVILPPALILDQANIGKVCTRVQFAANACPKKSIYGWARAFSPLLDKPLQGRVYLRSSDNTLPDLVSALKGQVNINLVSRTDSVRSRIRNIFDVVPDVPVNKFVLTLRGGRKGLLVNSRGLCGKKPLRAAMRFRAQNGKKLNRKINVRKPCGKKGKKGKRRGRR